MTHLYLLIQHYPDIKEFVYSLKLWNLLVGLKLFALFPICPSASDNFYNSIP